MDNVCPLDVMFRKVIKSAVVSVLIKVVFPIEKTQKILFSECSLLCFNSDYKVFKVISIYSRLDVKSINHGDCIFRYEPNSANTLFFWGLVPV